MTKYLYKIICTAIVVMIASPASAAITPLDWVKNFMYMGSTNLGNGEKCIGSDCDNSELTKCVASRGLYSAKPYGQECDSVRLNNGTSCYRNCKCSVDKYPYTAECGTENFITSVAKTDKCTDSSGTYYATCACGAGLATKAELGINTQYFTLGDPVIATNRKTNLPLECYNGKNVTCGGTKGAVRMPVSEMADNFGYGNFNGIVESKVEPVKYSFVSLASNKEQIKSGEQPACVGIGSATAVSGKSWTSEPTGKYCAAYNNTKRAAKYDSSFKYYYYTGEQKDDERCGAQADCVKTSSETVMAYYPDTGEMTERTFFYANGCKTGWNDAGQYFCRAAANGKGDSDTSKTYFNTVVTTNNYGGEDCVKVTGCNTANRYEKVAMGKTDIDGQYSVVADNAETDDTTRYDVKSTLSKKDENGYYGYLVCRIANGCRETTPAGNMVCAANNSWWSCWNM